MQCHDPPLEDEDIPEGDWVCIKCFASKPDLATRVTTATRMAATTTVTTRITAATDVVDTKKKPQVIICSLTRAYWRDVV